jgi:hypothetical protein
MVPIKPLIITLICKIGRRCPPWAGLAAGLFGGGILGFLAAGVPGLAIGLILGGLVRSLAAQFQSDGKALAYYTNPGASSFYEEEPGLAAFCALGILVSGSSLDSGRNGEAEIEQITRTARACFPRVDFSLAEYFCRLAWSCRERLNPSLLAESLVFRLGTQDKAVLLGSALYGLARNEAAQKFASEIRRVLDPSGETAGPGGGEDPWKLLGLSPGASPQEVKSHFRRLAIQFHPDALQTLDEERRETAAKAFIVLEKAYKEILKRIS